MQQAFSSILPVSNLNVFERFHMGIALLGLSGLFQGLTGLTGVAGLIGFKRPTPVAVTSKRLSPSTRPVWGQRNASCSSSGLKAKLQTHAVRPSLATPALRVLRVTESGQRVTGAGRMVISGRMADVCAELERLAALEAAQARI